MKNIKSGSYQPPDKRNTSISFIDFYGIKCFADADCDDSPSAGWQFVKYCMRG